MVAASWRPRPAVTRPESTHADGQRAGRGHHPPVRGQEHGHTPDRAATFAWLPSGDPEGPSIWTYLNAFSY